MGEPVRLAHREGAGRIAGNDGGRIDPDDGIIAGGIGGPLNDLIRFGEAIELRQMQRAAIPLEGGESARFALATGFKSEEAQLGTYRNPGATTLSRFRDARFRDAMGKRPPVRAAP